MIDEIHGLEHKNNKIDVFSLSPGQQVKVVQETKALFNPENPRNRIALNENYNIQLPLIEKRNASKVIKKFSLKYSDLKGLIYNILIELR